LVIVSDIHAGSVYTPCPNGFTRTDGSGVVPNVHGKFATAAWDDFVATVRAGGAYDLLVNGDCVEGFHHRTTEVWSIDPGDHFQAARQLLEPLVSPAGKVWFTRGTDCHVGSVEEGLAVHFGAERCPDSNLCAPPLWRFDYCGVHIHATHHMPTTSRKSLEATQLSVQLAEHQLQSLRVGITPPRMVIASHRHVGGYYTDFEGAMIATPAWQTTDGKHTKKVVPASKTRIGGIVCSWADLENGAIPRVHHHMYVPEES